MTGAPWMSPETGRYSTSSALDTDAMVIAQHLRQRAGRYFTEFVDSNPEVVLCHVRRRSASRLYHFELAATRGFSAPRRLVIKVPLERGSAVEVAYAQHVPDGRPARPRLGPVTAAADKHVLEYRAMTSLQRHLEQDPHPSVRAVRVLDHLPKVGGLVMEALAHPTLDQVTRTSLCSPTVKSLRRLSCVYREAGQLLRVWHAVPAPASTVRARVYAHEVHEAASDYMSYLAMCDVDPMVLRRLDALLPDLLLAALPTALPIAWCHGDYAPRNIFVLGSDQVATFDILGTRSAPIYEDVGYFLSALTASRLRALGQGLVPADRRLRVLEQAFLHGYFGTDVPTMALRAYQLLLLLDRWVGMRARHGPNPRTVRARVERSLSDRFFAAYIERSIQRLEGHPTGTRLDRGSSK